ncbi:MAG: RagB/SusD family nutrient uptake outer membrane protein, partial [Chitinophagaceae bacterium]|nr:RagB/SusD family nutrient uptake outer membrane protein [Chitinophagaceae bacterium]
DWNAGESGYLVKKWMDEEVIGKNEYNTNIWIYMRYPEVLLNFAEACIELNDESTAAIYINMVRNRAGLPDFEGDITAALRHERMIELAFEDLRNYDIRRWKILEDALTNAKGMENVETTNLDNGNVSTSWKLINIQDRSVSKRMYWLPVPRVEMAKAPQLTQNPEY